MIPSIICSVKFGEMGGPINVFSLKNSLIDDPCVPQNFEKYRPHKGREEKTSSHPWDPCGEHGFCSRPAENRAF